MGPEARIPYGSRRTTREYTTRLRGGSTEAAGGADRIGLGSAQRPRPARNARRHALDGSGAAIHAAVDQGYAQPTERIVVTAGVPFNTPGSTNILRVAPCQERLIYEGEPE